MNRRRMVLVTAGWLGAAVLAVLVGIAAIGVIGAGLTTPENRPRSAAEVDRLLRELPTPSGVPPASQGVGNAPPTSSSPSPPSSPFSPAGEPPAAASQTLPTRGGTVVARCAAGRPQIVSMSPRPGFALHEQGSDEGEFRSTADNHDRVKFQLTCAGPQPHLTLRTSGGGGDD